VVLSGTDKLAGSALRMNEGIANIMRPGGLSLREAVETATVNPARIIKLEGRMRGLKPGERGDIVVFRVVRGAILIEDVYLSGNARSSRT